MKTVRSSVFLVLLAIQFVPSLARSSETNSSISPSSSATPPRISSVVYTGNPVKALGMDAVSGDAGAGPGDGTRRPFRLKLFRPEGLSITNSRSAMFRQDDLVSFMVNAPTPTVNKALSLVSTIQQAQLDSTLIRWVQLLSLVSTRKINAELAYSAKVSRNSSFDSVISCKLHPATDSGVIDVAVRFQYGIRF